MAKPLDQYKTECRHGTSYTEIVSEYAGIRSRVLYYVPMGATHEVWRVSLENLTDRERKISVFSYVEFTTDSMYTQDLVNMQYTQFITKTEFHGSFLLEQINEFNYPRPDGTTGRERFLGLAGAPVASYTGRREQFLGRNRFDRPQAVLDGKCDNSLNYNANPCGALQFISELKPGEKKTAAFLLGQKTVFEAKEIVDRYADTAAVVDRELEELISYWHGELANLKISTPDRNFDTIQSALYRTFTRFDFLGIIQATTGSTLNLRSSIWPYLMMCLTCMGLKDGLYIYMLRQYFKNVPESLEEAAYVDGCSTLHTFVRIMLPDAVPTIASCFLFSFVWQWTDLFYSRNFLSGYKLYAPQLSSMTDRIADELSALAGTPVTPSAGRQLQLISIGVLFCCVPLIILYCFTQRTFVESLVMTGSKE